MPRNPKPALPPELLQRVREMRKDATDPEVLLWALLRNRRLAGAKFRRQHPVGGYILDFYCHEALLAIELDGSGHLQELQIQYDQERTEKLNSIGITVIRFWNHEVLNQIDQVLEVIYAALLDSHPSTGRGLG